VSCLLQNIASKRQECYDISLRSAMSVTKQVISLKSDKSVTTDTTTATCHVCYINNITSTCHVCHNTLKCHACYDRSNTSSQYRVFSNLWVMFTAHGKSSSIGFHTNKCWKFAFYSTLHDILLSDGIFRRLFPRLRTTRNYKNKQQVEK